MWNPFRRAPRAPDPSEPAATSGTVIDSTAVDVSAESARVLVSVGARADSSEIVPAPGPVRDGYSPALARARSLTEPPLDDSVALDAHVALLIEALQYGLTATRMFRLSEVMAEYQGVCADNLMVIRPWSRVSAELSKSLGLTKTYRDLPTASGGTVKTRVFFIPAAIPASRVERARPHLRAIAA